MTARCYVCDAPVEPFQTVDPRNARCLRHVAARNHVISVRTGEVVCQCGWTATFPKFDGRAADEACKGHWRDVCGDELCGDGA